MFWPTVAVSVSVSIAMRHGNEMKSIIGLIDYAKDGRIERGQGARKVTYIVLEPSPLPVEQLVKSIDHKVIGCEVNYCRKGGVIKCAIYNRLIDHRLVDTAKCNELSIHRMSKDFKRPQRDVQIV